MRKFVAITAVLMVSFGLSGCIPKGAGDYRIPSARPSPQSPQVVPENTVINPTPSWSPAIVVRNSQQVDGGSYVVQPGDTLYRIVSKTGASLTDIASANGLVAPYILQSGQQLTIPTGLYHNVNVGETGIAIARAYGVSWSEIVTLNNLTEPYVLNIGQRLRLPTRASAVSAASIPDPVSSSPSPEQQASAFSINIDDIVTGSEPALVQATPGAANPNISVPASVSLASQISRPGWFAGNFRWPADGTLISRFGSKGGGKVNDGINIAAANGAPVRASGDGVVVYSGNEIGVFGGLVLVDHGGGWVTAYGHLGQLTVARGDKITAGDTIGTVGETGYVNQPQLHFEIRKDRKPIDPMTKLSAR
jgi:murein DD-endopeptidase MepM/ murein hydrolase activator NlpD